MQLHMEDERHPDKWRRVTRDTQKRQMSKHHRARQSLDTAYRYLMSWLKIYRDISVNGKIPVRRRWRRRDDQGSEGGRLKIDPSSWEILPKDMQNLPPVEETGDRRLAVCC